MQEKMLLKHQCMQTKRKIKKRTCENYVGIWNKNLYNLSMANMPIGKICKTHILDTYQRMQANSIPTPSNRPKQGHLKRYNKL